MHRSLAVPIMLVSALQLACGSSPTDAADRVGLTSNAASANLATQSPTTTVEIKSEHVTAILPTGESLTLRLNVDAEGTDPAFLTGEGRHFGAAHSYWPASGSTDGTMVTLFGTITESSGPPLIGSPVEVIGNASTGDITFVLGPIAGGPRIGQTLVFTGTGKVTINTKD
jgi:hypothetical protein